MLSAQLSHVAKSEYSRETFKTGSILIKPNQVLNLQKSLNSHF